jgi:hypothetical protein
MNPVQKEGDMDAMGANKSGRMFLLKIGMLIPAVIVIFPFVISIFYPGWSQPPTVADFAAGGAAILGIVLFILFG